MSPLGPWERVLVQQVYMLFLAACYMIAHTFGLAP